MLKDFAEELFSEYQKILNGKKSAEAQNATDIESQIFVLHGLKHVQWEVCPCTCLHSSASLRSDSRNFCNQTDGRLGHVLQKIANNEYRWTWTVPVTAKLKMGSSLRNFQCFEIILLFDFKVLVAKSLSQILDNCIVIVFYFKPKRSVIIKIIIKWVAFVTFLSCYKDCSII